MLEVFLLGVLSLITLYWAVVRKTRLSLSGPTGLPFLGYGLFLGKEPHKKYISLAATYGPIFKVQLGMTEWVVLNNKELIREALVKHGKRTSGRVHNVMIDAIAKGKGVAFTEGPLWQTLRDFDIKAMKFFGTAKFEAIVREESKHLCMKLAEENGSPCDCELSLLTAVCNVSCHFTMGRRYDYNDPRYRDIFNSVKVFSAGDKKTEHFRAIMQMKFLRFLPGYKESFADISSTFYALRAEILRRLNEHKKQFNGSDCNDVMDKFLMEAKQNTHAERDAILTDEQVVFAVQDLLAASSDTTTNTLRWCIVGLSTNQVHQARMYEEIASVKEQKGNISMDDKSNLPFTRAYIQEILRFCTTLPLSLPHRSTEAFELGGYKIPANTPIITNLWAVHRSPDLFENPDTFIPERFIDSQGHFIPNENVIAFSIGTRRCLGEQLGRMEVFLFLTNIVSAFKILPDKLNKGMSMDEGMLAISYVPRRFRARFISRSEKSGSC